MKQVAQQEAEKARFLVEKAEQIKQANVISAEGDTQAAELIAAAMGKFCKQIWFFSDQDLSGFN